MQESIKNSAGNKLFDFKGRESKILDIQRRFIIFNQIDSVVKNSSCSFLEGVGKGRDDENNLKRD